RYLAIHRAPADPSHIRDMPAPARAVDRPPAPGRMHALPTPTPSHRPARRRTAPNGPPAEPRLALPARRAPPAPAPHSRQMRAPGADDLPPPDRPARAAAPASNAAPDHPALLRVLPEARPPPDPISVRR